MFANEKKLSILASIASFIVLAFIFIHINPTKVYDDLYFSKSLDHSSLLSFLSMRYSTWSGRVLLEAILVETINIKYLPAIIVTASFALLSFSMAKIATPAYNYMPIFFAVIAILSTCSPSASEAVFWVTGGYNYVMPFSFGFLSLLLLFKKEIKIIFLILSLVLAFIASNNEMFGAFAFMLSLLLIIRKVIYRKPIRIEMMYCAAVLAGLLFCFLAPGNAIRLVSETATWMPDFKYYNFFDKLTLGVDRLNSGVNQSANFSYILCCLATAVFLCKKRGKVIYEKVIILLVLIPVVHSLFHHVEINTPLDFVIRREYMRGSEYGDVGMYISYIITILVIGGMISCFYKNAKENYRSYFIGSCLFSAVGAVVAVGLSPTVQASGVRVMFLLEVTFVIATVFLTANSLKTKGP